MVELTPKYRIASIVFPETMSSGVFVEMARFFAGSSTEEFAALEARVAALEAGSPGGAPAAPVFDSTSLTFDDTSRTFDEVS
ncbi:hypothetical protein QO034_13370 [Sedimentitalea sp. JM2-8]|uniref:Uncharacterized protein n=1 Tax=Sedimentitalea xiamensis TaxID=3050037 RepID=A0ABT7FG54_9RHOB|nr:hypothetical protein [Sedimentitalea xiamensis]MDK3074106.1 hypothetical protein [Sedimentitalea xiamensis]